MHVDSAQVLDVDRPALLVAHVVPLRVVLQQLIPLRKVPEQRLEFQHRFAIFFRLSVKGDDPQAAVEVVAALDLVPKNTAQRIPRQCRCQETHFPCNGCSVFFIQASNHKVPGGDSGNSLVNDAGRGYLARGDCADSATKFVERLGADDVDTLGIAGRGLLHMGLGNVEDFFRQRRGGRQFISQQLGMEPVAADIVIDGQDLTLAGHENFHRPHRFPFDLDSVQ